MLKSFRPTATKAALTATPLLLAGGSTVASVAGASASPQSVPPPLDHQRCNAATATGFKIPSHVILKNALNPSGFMPKIAANPQAAGNLTVTNQFGVDPNPGRAARLNRGTQCGTT